MSYARCTDLIKSHEDGPGFKCGRATQLEAYLCPAGVWTIGWGHTRTAKAGMRIAPEEADRLLAEDIALVAAELRRVLKLELSEGRFWALVSLAYNLAGGPAALRRQAPKLWRHLHNGEWFYAANEFLTINKGGGKVLKGLVRRRVEEREMFLAG